MLFALMRVGQQRWTWRKLQIGSRNSYDGVTVAEATGDIPMTKYDGLAGAMWKKWRRKTCDADDKIQWDSKTQNRIGDIPSPLDPARLPLPANCPHHLFHLPRMLAALSVQASPASSVGPQLMGNLSVREILVERFFLPWET
jgi:hypothetical protein